MMMMIRMMKECNKKVTGFDIGRSYQMLLDAGKTQVGMKDVLDNLKNLPHMESSIGRGESYKDPMTGLACPSVDNALYLGRCCQYIASHDGNLRHLSVLLACRNRDGYGDIIRMAHGMKNGSLLKGMTFPGCHDFGVECDCDGYGCTWTYGERRCSCGNYKGFTWEHEGVDWVRDISLDSSDHVGYQRNKRRSLIEALDLMRGIIDQSDDAYEDYDILETVKIDFDPWLRGAYDLTLKAFGVDHDYYLRKAKKMHWRDKCCGFDAAIEMIYIEDHMDKPPSLEDMKRKMISYWENRKRNEEEFLIMLRVPGITTMANRLKQERRSNQELVFLKKFLSIIKY